MKRDLEADLKLNNRLPSPPWGYERTTAGPCPCYEVAPLDDGGELVWEDEQLETTSDDEWLAKWVCAAREGWPWAIAEVKRLRELLEKAEPYVRVIASLQNEHGDEEAEGQAMAMARAIRGAVPALEEGEHD